MTAPAETIYYKAAVNDQGQLRTIPSWSHAFHSLSAATFTLDEAKALEVQDCRPVVVAIVRAYKVQSDVVEI